MSYERCQLWNKEAILIRSKFDPGSYLVVVSDKNPVWDGWVQE
jgi:hypothetical protein